MYIKKLFIAICLIAINPTAKAQEKTNSNIEYHQSIKGASRLTLGLGHIHVSKGKVDGKTKWITLPSWSFNYDYWVSEKWAIGLQNDLILEAFIIESNKQELIERKYPLSMVPVVLFKPGKRLTLIGGIGAEFSKGHTLTMTRFGIEYGFHLPKNWEIGTAWVWDGKWNYYNSWGLAFTISKMWPKKFITN